MRLKKCVLSFLRKLVRVKMSLMSDGSAFQARDPAMEKKWCRNCKIGVIWPRCHTSDTKRTAVFYADCSRLI